MYEWEIRSHGDVTAEGSSATQADALREAFDVANAAMEEFGTNLTLEVCGEDVFVLPGNMWPDKADNASANKAALDSLRADLIAAYD